MDLDLMSSSSPQNHLEMMEMMMMMQQLKPTQFSRPYQDVSDSSDVKFSGGSATRNPFLSTSPPSITFMGDPIQESTPDGSLSSNNINIVRSSYINGDHKMMPKRSSMEAMREMIFRIAMMQPVHIDPESVKPPKRKNVKISKDPQSVAARHRRERISERIRILQRLVPGGTKMDTASMLDEAVHYVKFLKKQVELLEQASTFPATTMSLSSSANKATSYGGTYANALLKIDHGVGFA